MKEILTFIFLIIYVNIYSQEKEWFYSIEKAQKNPEKVKYLCVQNTDFKVLPNEVYHFVNLVELNLPNTFAVEYISNKISNLKNLEKLTLANCNLNHLPDSISQLKKISSLNLLDNNFTIFPKEILYFENLKYLNLTLNKISIIPNKISVLVKLTELGIGGNNIQFEEFEKVKKLLPDCKVRN